MPDFIEIDIEAISNYIKQGIDLASTPPLGTAINLVIGVFVALTIVTVIYDLNAGKQVGSSQ
jgi:hypothetical protein